jgi:tetratricopeptide (TPR) repeat protein
MSEIDRSQWQVLSRLLDEYLELDAAERAERLHQLTQDDPDLARELTALLDSHEAAARRHFLEHSAPNPLEESTLSAGQVVDRYTLDHLIGEGGMGAVWLAHRSDGRYEGEVAIKFLRLLSTGKDGAQRFQREGQVLARLKHSNVAQLLDAGVTAGNVPYLVLEYVQGEPIDQWCTARALNVRSRIELFLQVLAAVSHAHGKLILHRDLKPSNILVTAEGQAKLLDFGIAKLLEAGANEVTRVAERAFTLDYAAPEQIQGGEVTTATDVYSLGVLLYLLLTGQHPTSIDTLTPAERIRAVVETEPTRPSTLVAKTGAPRALSASAAQHARVLRGDLDNILAKALKKNSEERYPTADALAQDLRRYLNGQPVTARADSVSYRFRKFLMRNALAASAAAIVMIAIVAAALVSLWQAREARAQRDRALALSARNAAVVDFVSGMLIEGAPDDQPIRLSELLTTSEQLLLNQEVDPEHQAAILDLLSEYHLATGNPTAAQPLLDRALKLMETSQDAALRATLICNNAYAISLQNRRDEAIAALEFGIGMSRIDPLAASRCLQKRAFVAQSFNDPEAALRYALDAQAQLQLAAYRNPLHEASLLGDIAYAHYLSGNAAEADRFYAQALVRFEELGRADSPSTYSIRNNWGIASYAAGDIRRALENYDEALRISKQRNPTSDPPIYLLTNRALALTSLARYSEALKTFEEALAGARRANSIAAQLHALVNRAGTYLLMEDYARTERELAEIERTYADAIPPDSVPAIAIRLIKGKLAAARGNVDGALAELDRAVAFFDERQMSVAPLIRALSARSEVCLVRGDLSAARADAERALKIARTLQSTKPHSSLTGLSLLQLAHVEAAAGSADVANALALDAYQHLAESLDPEHPDTLRAQRLSRGE